jgi:hypothetical protein
MSICSFRSKSRDLLAQNQVIDAYLWGATCLSAALGVRAETSWLRIRCSPQININNLILSQQVSALTPKAADRHVAPRKYTSITWFWAKEQRLVGSESGYWCVFVGSNMSICSFRSKSRDLLAQNQVIDAYLWGATCLSAPKAADRHVAPHK